MILEDPAQTDRLRAGSVAAETEAADIEGLKEWQA